MRSIRKYLVVINLLITSILYGQQYPIYVGTYTSESNSDGVYIYNFNERTADFTFVQSIKMSNPSFLAKRNNVLYAVNEDQIGKVTAYDLRSDKVLSVFETKGAHPCHVSISPKDPILVVSNYSGGSLVMYSIGRDGSILKEEDFIQFNSSSINKNRQNSAHIHSAFFSKDGKRLYVSDLGGDVIYIYEIKKIGRDYKFEEVDRIVTKAGAGPRHVALSKNGRSLYVIFELTGEVATYSMFNNKWINTQILPIAYAGFQGEQGAADLKISKDGKKLYATNRGQANVYVQYDIKSDGKLKPIEIISVEGDSPRNINLSKKNKWVLVTNQNTNNISVFSAKNDFIKSVTIPKPVCVIF